MIEMTDTSDLYDPKCSLDANYQHLKYFFEGYREFHHEATKNDNPYSPGGPRERSWREGWELAKQDQKRVQET